MAKGNQRLRDIGELYSFQKSGEVRGVSTWSETSVSATTTHNHHGSGSSSSSTSVSSTSYEKQRFFLRRSDGREDEITLTDAGIAFRDGHHITLIYCGHTADQIGWPMGVFNQDTGRRAVFAQSIDWIIPKPSGKLGWLIVVFAIMSFRSIIFAIAAVGVVGFMIYNGSRRKRLRAEIRAEIERQLDEVGNRRASPRVTATPAAIGTAAA